jgi:hypothetical protein
MTIFTSLKNHAVQSMANKFLKPYGGEIVDLSIDKKNKKISATIALDGEIRSVNVTLYDVKIITQNSATFLSLKNVVVDRAWIGTIINALLQRYFPENKIEISRKLSGVLKMLI